MCETIIILIPKTRFHKDKTKQNYRPTLLMKRLEILKKKKKLNKTKTRKLNLKKYKNDYITLPSEDYLGKKGCVKISKSYT